MPFTLKKPNAAKWDLKSDQLESFNQAMDIVRGYGKVMIVREAVLVQLIQDFGGDRTLLCLERWCARAMTSLDRLQSLCEAAEPLTYEKQRMNETPGRERQRQTNQETMGVAKFLDNLKTDPNAPLAIPKPSERSFNKGKLREGHFDKEMMESWMKEHRPDTFWQVDDCFEYLGVAPGHGPVWKLIVRVSQ